MHDAIASVSQALVERCLDLLTISSITGNEAAIADHMQQWAQQTDCFAAEHIRRIGNNLLLGNPSSTKPTIALVGHLDTVPPHANDPKAHIDGDKLIGLGASDMKGAIAVMQVLMERLPKGQELPFHPIVLLYDREEGPYQANGLGTLLQALPETCNIDLAIVMEPTDNTIQLGCMGAINAEVRFVGKAAHSARPWQGDNAIYHALPLLNHLQQRASVEVYCGNLLFREVLHATQIRTNNARNVLPGEVNINLNYRFAPMEGTPSRQAQALAELEQLAAPGQLTITDVAPAGLVPHTNPLLQHLRSIGSLAIEPKQAWTDVARFSAMGIDALNFGPGFTSQAHQAKEYISLAAMVRSFDSLYAFLTLPLSIGAGQAE